ncbi:MAG: chloramphenicol acetyltransferase [Clostridiales bacterium]|nr:chloramphenicol acetyltransferase [Clostridiales bacterium]
MPKRIPMDHYPRRDHFRYFLSLANPFLSLTIQVDVTELTLACKECGASFYMLFLHAVAQAADLVPQLRQRIRGEGIVEYESCSTSHTELLPDDTYCYCTVHHHMPLAEYLPQAEAARAAARGNATIEEEAAEADSQYFISCLPWLHFTELVNPTGIDSNPRFTWGKYEPDYRGRLMLPLSICVHHGLVDGLHIARFCEHLEASIARNARELTALQSTNGG